jgi:ABC transport system ATP-binding/permease protein
MNAEGGGEWWTDAMPDATEGSGIHASGPQGDGWGATGPAPDPPVMESPVTGVPAVAPVTPGVPNPVPVPVPVPVPAATRLVVQELCVGPPGRRRLDGVSVDLGAGSFLAVLGVSGAGKSTLLKAITGFEPASHGSVWLDGADLYAHFGELRRRIGYVPQDDILHAHLTVFETLDYAARLRFPPDVGESQRRQRIETVIGELGLTARSQARVDELSGGQRKRVNVALELLTEPRLLILDEPTSGLDPGNERSMMELLRRLADGGRIVIVVTHSVESLHLCDQVLFLAQGGIPVYLGHANALPQRLGVGDLTTAFGVMEQHPDPASLRITPAPAGEATQDADPVPARPSLRERVLAADPGEIGRQFQILTERYLRVLQSDRRNLVILMLQAPVMAVLMVAVFGSGHLELTGLADPNAGNVIMAMVLAVVYLGASNAVREIVKERHILRREQNFGLSTVAYLGSKVVVLGSLTALQAALLVVLGTSRQSGPSDAVTLLPSKVELFVGVAACGLSALCVGLLISAVVNAPDKAMTLLPVMLFAQFLLAGLVFPVQALGVQQLSWFTAARWGLGAAAGTVDFWSLRGCDLPVNGAGCSVIWQHRVGYWLLSYVMLVVLGLAALWGAWASIVGKDPEQVLARARSGQLTVGHRVRNALSAALATKAAS